MGSSMRPFITLVVIEDRWHGRWSGASSWLLEAREVEPDKDNWHTKEGHGPIDGRDSGYITARSFEFTKKEPSSRMLLTYNDNLRAFGANKACRWEIQVDDKSCPSGKIVGDLYVVNDNPHRQHNLVGFCDQLAKGKHTMKVWVSQLHAGSDCYTGCVIAFCFWGGFGATVLMDCMQRMYALVHCRWNDSPKGKGASWVLDAREIPMVSLVHGITRHGQPDSRDTGFIHGREVTFTKKESSSKLRLLYEDTLRVHGSHKSCFWEIRIDGKSCSSGVIRQDEHVAGTENPHRFHTIIGYCEKIPAGEHKMSVYVGQIAAGSDCHTGYVAYTAFDSVKWVRHARSVLMRGWCAGGSSLRLGHWQLRKYCRLWT